MTIAQGTQQDMTAHVTTWALKQAYQALLKEYLAYVPLVQRLDRAYDILTRDTRYTFTLMHQHPVVIDVVGPNGTYTVIDSQRSCTCPDQAALCKHRLAVKMLMLALTQGGSNEL